MLLLWWLIYSDVNLGIGMWIGIIKNENKVIGISLGISKKELDQELEIKNWIEPRSVYWQALSKITFCAIARKYFWPLKTKKCFYFFIICFEKTFEHKVNDTDPVCFNRRQHRTKTHLLSGLWALFWLTPVRTSPGLPCTHCCNTTVPLLTHYVVIWGVVHQTGVSESVQGKLPTSC